MTVGDLSYNMFGLEDPRLKFINLGFGLFFFFRVNFVLLIQFITVQCKICEFGLGEYILQKGESSANVILMKSLIFRISWQQHFPVTGRGFVMDRPFPQ